MNGALSYPIKLENYGGTNGTATGILFKVDGGTEDRGKGAIVYERTDLWNRGDFHILQRPNLNDTLAPRLGRRRGDHKEQRQRGDRHQDPGLQAAGGRGRRRQPGPGQRLESPDSREYKRDIEPLDPAECRRILEEAAATDVVRYRFSNDPAGVRHLGVIAEESPSEIVASDGKGVSLGDYAAFLLAAIKAQQAAMEAQQAEIEGLKAQVKELESRVGIR